MPSALTVIRPAGVAALLLAAVAVTAAALYAYWPAGVAVGVALGAGAVVAIGARMQVTERLQPEDAELARTLGIAETPVAEPVAQQVAVAAPAPAPAPTPAPVSVEPVLHAQPDVLYFTSDDDPDVAEAREVVAAPESADLVRADLVRADLEQLKETLGDDYHDFARAARLVVSTQYASAARLQRDLSLPYSRARRLLTDLEEQHFVGPATGSMPRQVLLSKDRLPEVERLLAEV